MNELALFAGAGGGILGGKLLGWRTICAVEWEPYAASVLAARQNDGVLPPFPIWDDVRTFDGRPWRGRVDVVSGGFPCQDISVAGKGAGIDGARSGMWTHMARIVGEVRPRYVFVENSPALLTRGLVRVLGDLAALGYDCRWTVLGAADVGAPHQRDRFWLRAERRDVLAHTEHERPRRWKQQQEGHSAAAVAHTDGPRMEKHRPRNADSFVGSSAAISSEESQKSSGDVADADCITSQIRRHDSTDAQSGGCGSVGQIGGRSDDLGIVDTASDGEMAHADRVRELQPQRRQPDQWGRPSDCGAEVRHSDSKRLAQRQGQPSHDGTQLAALERADWWQSEPDVGRVANGVAARVDRLKAIGNGQVPLCAATAWRLLTETQ